MDEARIFLYSVFMNSLNWAVFGSKVDLQENLLSP